METVSGVKKRRTLFFVDRDHDDFLGGPFNSEVQRRDFWR
jgi:hypothetical protein